MELKNISIFYESSHTRGMAFSTYKNTYSIGTKYIRTKVALLSGEKRLDVNAFWDTGATRTHISERIAQLFELKPQRTVEVTGHRDKTMVNTYRVSMILPTDFMLCDFEVLSGWYETLNADVLIGMDIIQNGDFHMNYLLERPVFTFKHPNDNDEDVFIETELF